MTRLNLAETQVSNAGLAHFKNCKNLTHLNIQRTKVADLSLLTGMPLQELSCDFQADRLRSIKTLVTINGKPVAEFWKDVEAEPSPVPADAPAAEEPDKSPPLEKSIGASPVIAPEPGNDEKEQSPSTSR